MESSTRTEDIAQVRVPTQDAPTAEIRTAAGSVARDQCAHCGAALAPDQRYCVDCGARRGAPRMPLMDEVATQQAYAQPVASVVPPRRRMSSSATLIAGIATLLLALGVGVLIGRTGNSSSTKSPPVSIVTVGGGAAGASAGGAAGGTSTTASSTPTTSGSSTSSHHAAATPPSVKSGKVAPPPKNVVTVGSPGSGPGYQHGKFTGNFFGGG